MLNVVRYLLTILGRRSRAAGGLHHATAASVPDEGGELGTVTRDLGAHQHSEGLLRSVVDHVVYGIITIDGHGRIESFNPAAEKQLFGYSRHEVIGRNVKMLMPEAYFGEHDGYIDNHLRTGQGKIIGTGRQVVGRRKNSSTFRMELAVSEFHLGSQRFFTGIVRDITQRKRLEQQLRQRLDELRTADRQKNEFHAMLGHELRNALAPMRNALHLMNVPGIDESLMRKSREMIERQLHQLVRLVDDLLDVSRIISGKIELRKQPMDMRTAVERGVEAARPMIEARQHQMHTQLPSEHAWIDGDLIRLAQMIANLLTNAAKCSENGGRIWLRVSPDRGHVVLRVRDSGIGISKELLPRIFDVFVQADGSLARSQGGPGIGLTLVKRVVAMHGGTIDAYSAGLQQGGEFIVTLPALDAESSTHLTGRRRSARRKRASTRTLRNRWILRRCRPSLRNRAHNNLDPTMSTCTEFARIAATAGTIARTFFIIPVLS